MKLGRRDLHPLPWKKRSLARSSGRAEMRLFGVHIERRTNVLALAAFVLSVTAAAAQLSAFVRGPDVVLIPPEQVTIMCVVHGGEEYVHFSTTVAYVNKGEAGYNAAIGSERLTVELRGRRLDYQWVNFETVYVARNDQQADSTHCSRAGARLARGNIQPAAPFPVNAGAAVSHETTFAPRTAGDGDTDRNFMTWEEFMRLLEQGRELSFELVADVLDKKPLGVRCKIDVGRALPGLLEKGWSAPSCWALKD